MQIKEIRLAGEGADPLYPTVRQQSRLLVTDSKFGIGFDIFLYDRLFRGAPAQSVGNCCLLSLKGGITGARYQLTVCTLCWPGVLRGAILQVEEIGLVR